MRAMRCEFEQESGAEHSRRRCEFEQESGAEHSRRQNERTIGESGTFLTLAHRRERSHSVPRALRFVCQG